MTDQEFERILRQALHPEIPSEDPALGVAQPASPKGRPARTILKQAVAIAAVLVLLMTSVYAAKNVEEIAHFVTSGDREECRTYRRMDRIMAKAGFRIDAPEQFSNGFAFQSAQVENIHAMDGDRNLQFTFYQIGVTYENPAGTELMLVASPCINGLSHWNEAAIETRRFGDIKAEYAVVRFKYVPNDYQLTREDEKMLKKPNFQISYGFHQVTEVDYGYLNWEKDGICYSIVDTGQNLCADTLFSMAEELILGGE